MMQMPVLSPGKGHRRALSDRRCARFNYPVGGFGPNADSARLAWYGASPLRYEANVAAASGQESAPPPSEPASQRSSRLYAAAINEPTAMNSHNQADKYSRYPRRRP
jgi:hypothetical protein